MIRTAVFAAALAAASPALAFERTSIPAPNDDSPHFVNSGAVARLVPDGVSEALHFSDHWAPKGPMVVYELPKGKPAAHIDVNDPRDNPFMAQPERKSAPTR